MINHKSKNISIYYFGADKPWEELLAHGFRRRNTCFLQSIVNNNDVSNVFVIRQSTRAGLIPSIFKSKKVTKKVTDVFVTTILPEQKYIPFAKLLNQLTAKLLIVLQTKQSFKPTDVVWVYWVKAFLLAQKIGIHGKYIFDVDHNIIDDENLPESKKQDTEKTLITIAKKSSYILSSSRSMITWFEDRGFSNCLMVRNGIDPSRFTDELPEPDELVNISHPRILYVGTLSKWINTELLVELIKKHPEWNFIFIGGNYKTGLSDILEALPNVTLLGFKLAGDVPNFMKNVDIALGMYRNIFWLDVDSMKFYEYLAAGVPVVSTNYHPNINTDFNELIFASNNLIEIEEKIANILSGSKKNKKEWKQKAKSFVETNTWDDRVNQVIKLL